MLFFFGKFVGLTDEEFAEEVAARYADARVPDFLRPRPERPRRATTPEQ